ncbi:hypothetical protein KFE25_012557 [Diacronema lutheri]|uniref:Chitin-binding type-1 domain-containing protein n=1 Tax=Diacronema lutheri TaxID=2081491 RepID=A0A8J5XLA1_DIALT|nr:hypothetical protein KFE25_012557 [Diacronema lutheri]
MYARRGADAVAAGTGKRRMRTLVVALALTFLIFVYTVHVTHRQDEEAVWIWMGMRSDGRCGRDFGTEHIDETRCGKGSPCCSAHGWCGSSEEYCSATLGCQSGCWGDDHPRERELKGGAMTPPRADVGAGDWDDEEEHSDSDWDDAYDEEHGYPDDDGDHDYGEYHDGGGRHGAYRRRGAYGYGDDDYYGDDHGPDEYEQYVDTASDDIGDDDGLYHGGDDPYDPLKAEGGDLDGDEQEQEQRHRHGWEGDGKEAGEPGEAVALSS